MKNWFLVLVLLFVGAISVPMGAISAPMTTVYTVVVGDTVSRIAKRLNVTPAKVCGMNNLRDCNKLRIGQKLLVFPLQTASTEKSEAAKEKSQPVAMSTTPRKWVRVGADRLLKKSEWKAWGRSANLEIHPEQERRMARMGFTSEQVVQVRQDARARRCRLVTLPRGTVFDDIAMGRGNWGRTEIAVKGGVEAWECPPVHVGGKLRVVYLPLGCGNVGYVSRELPPEPVAQLSPEVEEIEPTTCSFESGFGAHASFGKGSKDRSGFGNVSCQFRVNDFWTAGPLVAVEKGIFETKGQWRESTWYAGIGARARGKEIGIFDDVSIDATVGLARRGGGTPSGSYQVPKFTGLDFRLSSTLSIKSEIDKDSSLVTELMPFINIPLTNKEGDGLWMGERVKSEQRNLIGGASVRMGYERNDWKVVPEVSVTLYGIQGSKPGSKLLVGLADKPRTVRCGVGLEGLSFLKDPHGIVECEWNPGRKSIILSQEKADEAIQSGKRSSREALGLVASADEGVQNLPEISFVSLPSTPAMTNSRHTEANATTTSSVEEDILADGVEIALHENVSQGFNDM